MHMIVKPPYQSFAIALLYTLENWQNYQRRNCLYRSGVISGNEIPGMKFLVFNKRHPANESDR